MENFIHTEFEELDHSEIREIYGGDDFLGDVAGALGRFFGRLCSFASFEDSNTVNEGYVGRGM